MPTRIVTVSELKVKLGALMAELERQRKKKRRLRIGFVISIR